MSEKARKLYETFHGKSPRGEKSIKFPKVETLVCLGDAIEIVYKCDKLNGGGDGRQSEYVDKFKKGAKLFTDQDGRGWLFIHGPQIVVKEPGIIN